MRLRLGLAIHWLSDALHLLAHWVIADPEWRARNGGEPDSPLGGLPADLAAVLRDQSVIIPQDARVFEMLGAWANAPVSTASAEIKATMPQGSHGIVAGTQPVPTQAPQILWFGRDGSTTGAQLGDSDES